ncbi:MAG: hypothetical protein KA902_04665, partial [Arenimonas sp.]|nr:hypothetical protein [Arenimonas sp.]
MALIIGLSLLSFQVYAENELRQASELRLAFAQAKQATLSDSTIQSLGNNPLLPWLKAINLKQGIATATQQQVLEIIGNQSKDPAYQWLIGQWRTELIKRQDWQGV